MLCYMLGSVVMLCYVMFFHVIVDANLFNHFVFNWIELQRIIYKLFMKYY